MPCSTRQSLVLQLNTLFELIGSPFFLRNFGSNCQAIVFSCCNQKTSQTEFIPNIVSKNPEIKMAAKLFSIWFVLRKIGHISKCLLIVLLRQDRYNRVMNGPLNFLENNKDKIIELQSLLTSIPAIAPEGGGDGELEKCQALEKWLRENGITDLQRFDSPDSRVACGVRPNLVATIAGEDSALGEKGSSMPPPPKSYSPSVHGFRNNSTPPRHPAAPPSGSGTSEPHCHRPPQTVPGPKAMRTPAGCAPTSAPPRALSGPFEA